MNQSLSFHTDFEFSYGEASWITPTIRRIVANNPSPFTFKGTNSYIVGRGEVALIDPGPDDTRHLDAILNALKGEKITHIIITHTHKDHVAGLDALKTATGAKVYGFGQTSEPRGTAEQSPSQTEFVDRFVKVDHTVADGDQISGSDWALQAVHTPGHAPDHLCFDLVGSKILFSGDHVMGWNTSVIAPPEGKMSHYLNSLEKLLARNDEFFLPGHGGRVTTPGRVVKAFLIHRNWRESAIVDCLKNGSTTVSQIAANIYKDLNASIANAASLSVLAHLEHLIERGIVSCDGTFSLQARFSLI